MQHYFLQLMNKSLSQEVFVTLLQLQNACYLSLLIFRTLQYASTGEIPTHSYLKPEQWDLPLWAIIGRTRPPPPPTPTTAYLKVWIRHCNVQYKPAQLLGFRVDGFMPQLLFCYSATDISRGLLFF